MFFDLKGIGRALCSTRRFGFVTTSFERFGSAAIHGHDPLVFDMQGVETTACSRSIVRIAW